MSYSIDGQWQLAEQFAIANGYSKWYTLKLCREGKVPAAKMNGKWYVDLKRYASMLAAKLNQGAA